MVVINCVVRFFNFGKGFLNFWIECKFILGNVFKWYKKIYGLMKEVLYYELLEKIYFFFGFRLDIVKKDCLELFLLMAW